MIRLHPLVKDVAIVGAPDPVMGERMCAFVVPAGPDAPSLTQLVSYLREEYQLAVQKLPERLEIVDALPMNATGKVQKFVLREMLAAATDGPASSGL